MDLEVAVDPYRDTARPAQNSNLSRTLLRASSKDPDQLAEIYQRTFSPVRIRPLCRTQEIDLHVNVRRIDYLSIMSSMSESGFILYPERPLDAYLIHLSETGTVQIETDRGLWNVDGDTAYIGDASKYRSVLTSTGRKGISISIDKNAIVSLLSEAFETVSLPALTFQPTLQSTDARYAALIRLARTLLEGQTIKSDFDRPDLADFYLTRTLLQFVAFEIPHNLSSTLGSRCPIPSPRQVRRAVEFIEANIQERIAVEDVARAAGTSLRSLQGTFKNVKGLSLVAYIRTRRLQRVREDILSGKEMELRHLARAWGFTHLGYFARSYEEAFGELPSETVRRLRRR